MGRGSGHEITGIYTSLEPRPSTQFFFAAVEKIAEIAFHTVFFHSCEKNCVEGLGSRLDI